jgi:hypothetical protein
MKIGEQEASLYRQSLPSSGIAREMLRQKGQFWTPPWVADAMVAYVLQERPQTLFDPAVGAGVFFRSARKMSEQLGFGLELKGTEFDPTALAQAQECGTGASDLAGVYVRDFVLDPPKEQYPAIVANPPYMRHHRLSAGTKAQLRVMARAATGIEIDGRAGYHVYFLIRALTLLEPGGRLCFIMPSDTCEGVFAAKLWSWITRHYRLDAVVTFAPEATPFPGVDTNAIIFMIQNAPPRKKLLWARCLLPERSSLVKWVQEDFRQSAGSDLLVMERVLEEAVETGLSRPFCETTEECVPLGSLVRVMRGIATGDNSFFLMTGKQAAELEIPAKYFVRVVSRTRDVEGDTLEVDALRGLDKRGRPTYLLAISGDQMDGLPDTVVSHLHQGERLGLPSRPLIAQRTPWFRMERRSVPPFLFAYLGRRNARFIRNKAGALPLTGFLCVYPRDFAAPLEDKLWHVLRDPKVLANLPLVGKSYGSGAIKVEPRALERLPVPLSVLKKAGLALPHPSTLFSESPGKYDSGQNEDMRKTKPMITRRARASKVQSRRRTK